MLPTDAIVLPVKERTEPVNIRTGGNSMRAMMKMIDQVFMVCGVLHLWGSFEVSNNNTHLIRLGEEITRFEIFGFEDVLSVDTSNELSYIPEEIFLKDSFSADTKFLTKCIQSRFCGV
jgi:hypothetical protein